MRVSKVKELAKRLLRLRVIRARRRLFPPYDCPLCESFDSVQVTRHEATIIFHCHECDQLEVILDADWMDMIDQFNLVADKWLAERYGRDWKEPIFNVEIDLKKDRKKIRELRSITLGEIRLFIRKKTEGGVFKKMPISIKEAEHLPREAPPRSKVDWDDVINRIIESGEYYSAKEVQEIFVEGKVKVFRTKSMLDKAVEEGRLGRVYDKRKYWYGRPLMR